MTAAKTMPLPPPCGMMTVTYEIDRKVKEPVFNESALRRFAENAQEKDAETIRVLLKALISLHAVCEIALEGKNGQQHSYFESRCGHFVEASGAMQQAEDAIAEAAGDAS